MADAAVAEETREVGAAGSGEGAAGGAVPPVSESAEPSVADVMRDAVGDGDGSDEDGDGDGAQGRDAAGGANPHSGVSPGVGESSKESASDRLPDGGAGTDGDDVLPLRESGSEAALPDPTPGNIERIRATTRRQAEAVREDASEKAAVEVRKEVRRILGLDGRPDFEAESVSHVMGLARDGERVDPELEKELRAELDALGVDLGLVHLRYDSMSKEDRRQLTTFEVQQAFLRVVERVDELATRASVSLGHRIRMFDDQARDQLKLVAGLTVLLETQHKQVEDLVAGFRRKMQEETEAFEQFVSQEKKTLTGKVKDFQMAFEGVDGHLKSCQTVTRELVGQLESAGAASSSVGQEASRVMTDLQRVANSGLAVRRLALLGGVVGSAAGGFFAFVVLLLLWAATSG